MSSKLSVFPRKPYFSKCGKPFFWLGDTAWLLFSRTNDEEACLYLKDRASKGFNVIQATLIHFWNKPAKVCGASSRYYFESEDYWKHCDYIIDKAAELGLYMALLPSWGDIVRDGYLNMKNVDHYIHFLIQRYKSRENIIWLLGGDIKGAGHEDYYNYIGKLLKAANPDRLIGYHPNGRRSSSQWFNDADWLDFHMCQSGHRRYDQYIMGAWDDLPNPQAEYGEDNWKFIEHDLKLSKRPALDGEPSYEGIHQGLFDLTQPLWTDYEIRRYAYWSVFAGAAGHTYGNNSVMQFFDSKSGFPAAFGANINWIESLDQPGALQMRYLKQLMESFDFTEGHMEDGMIIGGQRERLERVAVFAAKEFALCYTFLGKPFQLDVSQYIGKDIWKFNPSTGKYTLLCKVDSACFEYQNKYAGDKNPDSVIVIK